MKKVIKNIIRMKHLTVPSDADIAELLLRNWCPAHSSVLVKDFSDQFAEITPFLLPFCLGCLKQTVYSEDLSTK